MGLLEDLFELGNQQRPQVETVVGTFTDYLTIIGMIAVIGVLGFFAYTAWKNYSSYAGHGEPLGIFRIVLQGKWIMTGNLSVNEEPDEYKINLLKKVPNFEDVMHEMDNMIKNKKLFFYDFKATDNEEAWIKSGENYIIVSRHRLEDGAYSWVDKKGIFRPNPTGLKIKPRNVVAFETSKIFQDQDQFGNDLNIINLVPVPRGITVSKIIENELERMVYELKLDQMPDSPAFGKFAKMATTMFQVYKSLDDKDTDIDNKDKIIDDLYKKLQAKNIIINQLRNMLSKKPLVVFGKQLGTQVTVSNLVWLIIFALGGYSPIELKKIPELATFPEYILLAVVLAVLFIIKKMTENNKPTPEKIDEDEILN
jgi:hypothetical protein